MIIAKYAVIGLGRFGRSVACNLAAQGHHVLGIDSEPGRVEEVACAIRQAVQADGSDIEILRYLGLERCDTVVVAIGRDMEASLLTTLALKELGVARVVVKAESDEHGRVLERVGADRVVYPQRDMGRRVAHFLASPLVQNYVDVAAGFAMTELAVGPSLQGRSLSEIRLPERFGVNVLVVKRQSRVLVSPPADLVLVAGDTLVLIGSTQGLSRLEHAHT